MASVLIPLANQLHKVIIFVFMMNIIAGRSEFPLSGKTGKKASQVISCFHSSCHLIFIFYYQMVRHFLLILQFF